MNNAVLKEAKKLHDFGWAIHWLRPRAKMPVEAKWTTGARKTWDELKASYNDGYNIGVRTGSASKIGEHYLMCFDLDVKDANCASEAIAFLERTLGERDFAIVKSGSGGASCHAYAVSIAPFKMLTLHKEPGWELCAYSEGRQMVLPPSIHPNGRPYVWSDDTEIKTLPVVDASKLLVSQGAKSSANKKKNKSEAIAEVPFQFCATDVNLDWLEISDEMKAAIKTGAGVKDRSGFLLKASGALLSAGCSHDEVLSVLTDARLFLGKCGYDHAQTKDRARAAAWVHRYTLKKVSDEKQESAEFLATAALPEAVEATQDEAAQNAEAFNDDAAANGFYSIGARGALTPEYDALLAAYYEQHPYRMIADMKNVFIFNGTHYVDTTPFEIKAFCERVMSPKPAEKIRHEFICKVLANNIARRSFFSESTEGKLNFKNGVLDLNSWDERLLEHSPDYGFRGVLPYDYDPDADCPVFRKWIQDVMLGDAALVNVLQEYMGYIVRGGEYKYHKALWLGGIGRNGKSTFVDVLKALIGVGNFSVISIKSLMADKFAGADLDGKIANFSEETSPEELRDSGPFKNLTGDGDIFAQKKFGDPYNFRNRAKLVMTYNQIPDLKDLTSGMLSRPLIIPFEKIIGEDEQDRNIKKKLFKELPGIFNFALDGWHRLEQQEGFTVSDKSALALKRVKEESCNAYQWVENHVIGGGDKNDELARFRPHQLYSIYEKQERYSYKATEFYRRINEHPTIKISKRKTNEGALYEGLKIT